MNVTVTPPREVIPPALAEWAVTHVDLSDVAPGEFVVVTIEQATGRTWDKGTAVIPPHPAPEVPNREAAEAEIPRAAKTMRALAVKHGWAVRATFARGTVLHQTGKPGKVVDSIALRMHAVNRAAWGVWHDGKFNSAQVWGRGDSPINVGATHLKAFLSAVTL